VAPFTYAWQLAPPSNSTSAVLFNDRSAQPSFVPDVSGSYNYSVTVTDATGAQATVGSAAGTPTPPFVAHNCAITPSIVPGGPTTGLNVGASQALTGSFTVNADCAGLYTGSAGASPLPVRYEWSFDSVPAGSVAVLSNANGAGASFTVDRPGSSSTWVVRLTARDQLTGASASTTASFSASSCGTAPISAFAGVLNASLPCNGTLCTWTFTAPAAQFVAVPHPCPPNSQSTCVGAAVDLFMTVGTLPLPYFVELFAGDPTSTGVSTVRYSTGSPNAACGGVLTYAWTLYAAPPGSAAATTTSIGPSNAGQPTAKLDVKGLYVFQLVETEQFPGTSSLPPRQSTSYFQISVQ
jgi:hypothetical protein